MSHVDEGTLHAYLDGELPAGEAHDLEAHVAQCRECRVRLDEERALIARADELLGLAAPPDRAVPPFRPGDREPPVRLWWRVRLPLAWAATVVLALGAGLYLGSGVLPRQRAVVQNSGDVATAKALPAPAAPEPAAVPPAAPRQMQRVRSAPAAPTTVAAERKSAVKDQPAEEVAAELAQRAFQRSTAPAPTVGRIVGPYALTGPPLTLDSARALVGTDPYAVPELPVRGIYRARMIGYSAVVVVQQPLDSSTAIDVITGRYSPTALDAVVVSGAVRRDSVSPTERALLGRAPADSLAAQRRAQPRPAPAPGALADRSTAALVVEVRGPLPADSLAALQRRLAPLRP
ncbi:MAG: hypothetical protein AUI13_01135 [Gemmatimonadetes bacterium 13_2_20CM_2_69_23]|nr:MAG: hypothetical protein AUI13_01135 [Gemmatimonadetes bacterium 13_2_20CM_2_69_23]PYO31731.1 MAG: hypothetical protein DMD32_07695 [Gemmatimonadota bacterium]